MILGLDVSTSITGVTIVDRDNQIVHTEYWNLKKHKDFFDKSLEAKIRIADLFYRFGGHPDNEDDKIEHVYIEQSLQSFRSGFSSAKTLSTLARYNGVISWLCYDTFDIKPEYIAASSARKLNGIKIPKGEKAKEVVLQYLLDNEPSFKVEYTKYNNVKAHYYDISDSIIVARAGLRKVQDAEKENKNSERSTG
tara:strand:- start:23969 stop:24550 length:582 start_codon:yes stop_codon:yes gene_type:complete